MPANTASASFSSIVFVARDKAMSTVLLATKIPRIELGFYDGLNWNPSQETISMVQTPLVISQSFFDSCLICPHIFQGLHHSSSRIPVLVDCSRSARRCANIPSVRPSQKREVQGDGVVFSWRLGIYRCPWTKDEEC